MSERKIFEKTYNHVADIYRFTKREDEDGSSIEERELIYSNIKCALSKDSLREVSTDSDKNFIKQNYTIFISDEYKIQAFDIAEINKKFYTLGESMIYEDSHQEIKARLE